MVDDPAISVPPQLDENVPIDQESDQNKTKLDQRKHVPVTKPIELLLIEIRIHQTQSTQGYTQEPHGHYQVPGASPAPVERILDVQIDLQEPVQCDEDHDEEVGQCASGVLEYGEFKGDPLVTKDAGHIHQQTQNDKHKLGDAQIDQEQVLTVVSVE